MYSERDAETAASIFEYLSAHPMYSYAPLQKRQRERQRERKGFNTNRAYTCDIPWNLQTMHMVLLCKPEKVGR